MYRCHGLIPFSISLATFAPAILLCTVPASPLAARAREYSSTCQSKPLIAHLHEDEALCGSRRRAIIQLGPQEVSKPARVLLARPHLLQGADDLSHHIPEKAVRPNVDDEEAVLLRDLELLHRLYSADFCRGEVPEIVLAQ